MLTGTTKISLSQIDWSPLTQDKHDNATIGTVRQWADKKYHVKTMHGWKIATTEEIKRAKKVGPIESYTKASRTAAKNKPKYTGLKMEKLNNERDIHNAIQQFKQTKEPKIYNLGTIAPRAKRRIKAATGLDPEKVILDTTSLTHAFQAKHNLQPDDLDKMKEIVDTTKDIRLSKQTNGMGLPVIIFRQQEQNGLYIVMEFRAKKLQLELQTAYRQKKAPNK